MVVTSGRREREKIEISVEGMEWLPLIERTVSPMSLGLKRSSWEVD